MCVCTYTCVYNVKCMVPPQSRIVLTEFIARSLCKLTPNYRFHFTQTCWDEPPD